MEINTVKSSSHIIIQIIGNFDQQGAIFLRNKLINEYAIAEEIPAELPHVVFDFSQIESISSSGIGLLASLQRTFNRSNKRLSLVKIPHSLQQILRVANLMGVFSIYKTAEDAINGNKEKN